MTDAPLTRWCLSWIRAIRCMKRTPARRCIAPLIAAASGPLGTNAQYLFSLDQELGKRGMQEEALTRLAAEVRALQQSAARG